MPRKPNLIIFLPGQQRADTIACYGSEKVHFYVWQITSVRLEFYTILALRARVHAENQS